MGRHRVRAMNEDSVALITASELGQHAFCARSWWLGRVRGCASSHADEMHEGRAAHMAHGQSVVSYLRLRWIAYALLGLAVLATLVGVLSLRRVLP